MRTDFDAIVIGAGHNGLIAAAYLARAGQRVLVLEQRPVIGGAAATEALLPGCRVDVGAPALTGLCPDVVTDLNLGEHGLRMLEPEVSVFAPQIDGSHLLISRDPDATRASVAALSSHDAKQWDAFATLVRNATDILEGVYRTTPPDVTTAGARDLWPLVKIGSRLRRQGKRSMMEVMRLLPMTLKETLDEWFEHDAIRGALAAAGVIGIFQGPMSAGTTLAFLNQHVGSNGHLRPLQLVQGGTGRLADALAASAVHAGAEVRTGRTIERIDVEHGRATGVTLASGERFTAPRVISNVAPGITLTELVHPSELEPGLNRRISNIRYRGAAARVHVLLNEAPDFSALPGSGPHLGGVISIAPHLMYLERAYDDAKHGGISEHLHIEATVPTYLDPDRAPDGQHVMSMTVQFVPYRLAGGWTEAARNQVGDAAVATMSRYAPNLQKAVTDRCVMTPPEFERVLGLPEGNMYHGELAMDQMFFMRPVPECARYRTPIQGLYLCGAGTHPGGGVNGYSGFNAAREILADS